MKPPLFASAVIAAILVGAGSLSLITATGRATPTSPAEAARPVVVELFTSQGCSSCPPADALLEKLSREPGVVAITRPVTYWDQLGWKDTLAQPANTKLQQAYGARNLPGGGVYTPEIVVQGRYGAVGSDERRIRRLIAQAREADAPSLIVTGDSLHISGGTGKAAIEMVTLRPNAMVNIGRGENGGRQIRYVHVLQSEKIIGQWIGRDLTLVLPAAARSTGGTAVLLLRSGKAGPILAARML
jgi:hypothetical protein